MKKVSKNATAQEKADQADGNSIMLLPVSVLLILSGVSGLIFYGSACILMAGNHHWALEVLASFGISCGLVTVELAIMAIYKWQRDHFWRALDAINALDLRRAPRGE
jgi:hypothetical protein